MRRLSAYETHKLIKQAIPDCPTHWERHEKVRQIDWIEEIEIKKLEARRLNIKKLQPRR